MPVFWESPTSNRYFVLINYLTYRFWLLICTKISKFVPIRTAQDYDDCTNQIKPSKHSIPPWISLCVSSVFCRRANWDVSYPEDCLIMDFLVSVPVKIRIARKILVHFQVLVGVVNAKFHHIFTKMFSLRNLWVLYGRLPCKNMSLNKLLLYLERLALFTVYFKPRVDSWGYNLMI